MKIKPIERLLRDTNTISPLGSHQSILVAAYNIYEGGGKIILEGLIKEFLSNGTFATIIVNEELQISSPDEKKIKIERKPAGFLRKIILEIEIQRKVKKFDALLMLGNFPPILKNEKPTYLFIQNVFFLESLENIFLTTGTWLKPLVQKAVFLACSRNAENVIVQTNHMMERVKNNSFLKNKNTFLYNFIDLDEILSITITPRKKENAKSIIYLASDLKHKNHEIIHKSLGMIKKNIGSFEFIVCLNKKSRCLKTYEVLSTGYDFKLKNISGMTRSEVLKSISESSLMIYPSLNESLGLPIIESIILRTPVILPHLRYAYEFKNYAEAYFEPRDPQALTQAIVKFFKLQDQ